MDEIKKAIAELIRQVKEELEDLLRPRTLITFAFYGVFLYLILKGSKIPDSLNTIISSLFGYYFGSKTKNNNDKK